MDKTITKILTWQGDLKIDMIQAGLSENIAGKISADYIQKLIDSNLLNAEAQDSINNFLKP